MAVALSREVCDRRNCMSEEQPCRKCELETLASSQRSCDIVQWAGTPGPCQPLHLLELCLQGWGCDFLCCRKLLWSRKISCENISSLHRTGCRLKLPLEWQWFSILKEQDSGYLWWQWLSCLLSLVSLAAAPKQKLHAEELNRRWTCSSVSAFLMPKSLTTRPISQGLHSCDVQLDPWEIRNKALIEKSEHRNQGMSQSYSSCLCGMSHGLKSTWTFWLKERDRRKAA